MVIGSARRAVVRFATRADLIHLRFSSVVSVSDDVSYLYNSISTGKMNLKVYSLVYHDLIVNNFM